MTAVSSQPILFLKHIIMKKELHDCPKCGYWTYGTGTYLREGIEIKCIQCENDKIKFSKKEVDALTKKNTYHDNDFNF